MGKRVFVVTLAILVITANAFAFELKTPVTDALNIDEDFLFIYDMTDPDKDMHFYAAINHLSIQVTKGDMLAGLRYDVESYFEKDEYAVRYVPEKVYFQIDKRYWELRLGDYYTNFGRGLTLTLLKNDQFGEDTTLQGAAGKIKSEYFNFQGLGGIENEYNTLRYEPSRAKHGEQEYEDRDIIGGGSFTTGHPSYVLVGGNFVYGVLRMPEGADENYDKDDSIMLASGSLEAPDFKIGSFYGEYAFVTLEDQRDQVDSREFEGRGAYAEMLLQGGPVSLLAEGQDYWRLGQFSSLNNPVTYTYHEPPNLEYDKTGFNHEPIKDDILGYKLRMDVTIDAISTLVYGAYYNSRTHDFEPESLEDHYSSENSMEWIEHTYGGFEITTPSAGYFFASGGYRENQEDRWQKGERGRWTHAELEAGIPFMDIHEITIGGNTKLFNGMEKIRGIHYGSMEYSLGYSYSPYFSVSGRYEYSTEPAIAGFGMEKDDDPNFYAGEVTIEPNQHVTWKLMYGREKGGIECSGGLCRTVPPFEGAKTELILRF